MKPTRTSPAIPVPAIVAGVVGTFLGGLILGTGGGYYAGRHQSITRTSAVVTPAPPVAVANPAPAPAPIPAAKPQPKPAAKPAAKPAPETKPEEPKKRYPLDMDKFKAIVSGMSKAEVIALCGQPDEADDSITGNWGSPGLIYHGPFTMEGGYTKPKVELYFRRGKVALVDFIN